MSAPRISTGSLRLRFLLAVMLWVALGVAGIWFTATRVFERHIEEMYHEELEVHVRELARLTELDEDGRPRLTSRSRTRATNFRSRASIGRLVCPASRSCVRIA